VSLKINSSRIRNNGRNGAGISKAASITATRTTTSTITTKITKEVITTKEEEVTRNPTNLSKRPRLPKRM
jgi:hypothetical protein